MPTILRGIVRFAIRGALIWAGIGLIAVPIAEAVVRQDPQISETLIDEVGEKAWFWGSIILFGIAGAVSGIAYCCCLALCWTGGVRIPTELDGMFGRSMTLAEARSRTPMTVCSILIGAGLGLVFLPPEIGPLWSQAIGGGFIGLVGAVGLFVSSPRTIDRYSRYLR